MKLQGELKAGSPVVDGSGAVPIVAGVMSALESQSAIAFVTDVIVGCIRSLARR